MLGFEISAGLVYILSVYSSLSSISFSICAEAITIASSSKFDLMSTSCNSDASICCVLVFVSICPGSLTFRSLNYLFFKAFGLTLIGLCTA